VCGLTLSGGTEARLQKSFFNPHLIHNYCKWVGQKNHIKNTNISTAEQTL
jgi:hypothetical protein